MSGGKKRLDTDQVASELSESAFFRPTSPQTDKPASGQTDKPTSPQVEKTTNGLAGKPTSGQTRKTTSTQVEKPAKLQVDKATSGGVDETTKPLVEKYTTHLRPGTIKAIKVYAALHDMKDYEVAQMAFDRLLQGEKEEL